MKYKKEYRVTHKSTGKCGYVIGIGPRGWLWVWWIHGDKPVSLKRTSLKVKRALIDELKRSS